MKDLKLNRFETCDYAMTAQDGKLSIIGVFDRIFVRSLPVNHPSMCFVVVAKGEPGTDHKLKLVTTAPSGKKINDIPINIKTNNEGHFNVIATLNNLPITEQGVLTIDCFDGDKKIGTKEVVISMAPVLQGSKVKN
ncbi:MAG: hypothetical protein NT149_01330 [Candidatus Gottesmanbacteria bacterium]|nr:hypothetical protein [Candidatus Gottesmanbacteria bacterium]